MLKLIIYITVKKKKKYKKITELIILEMLDLKAQ